MQIMDHSFDHRTRILNSLDDQVLSAVDHTGKRVVTEMDFFTEKKTNNNIFDGKDDAGFKKKPTEDGNRLNLGLRVCMYVCIYVCVINILKIFFLQFLIHHSFSSID